MVDDNSRSGTLRAVAYYRKSNEDGGESVKQQREWAREAEAREGFKLLAEFADEAVAGHDTARRTDFHRMLEFCKERARQKRPVDMIVCWHPNRFSRADSQETSWYVWEYRRIGVAQVFTATRRYDFDRPEDRLVFGIEQETSCHGDSLRSAAASTRGRVEGAREGRWQGGPIPYGYRGVREEIKRKGRTVVRTARLIKGPDAEVDVVKRIFREYAHERRGMRQIADRLNAEGVPPPRGGSSWGTNTVKRILRNPVYLGRLVWGRRREGKFFAVVKTEVKPVPTATAGRSVANPPDAWIYGATQHDAIIDDPATWEKCEARLARSRTQATPRLGAYALSGLVRCGHCGANMIARVNRPSRPNGKVHTYRRVFCGMYNRAGKSRCGYNAVDADALVRAVLAKLRAGLEHPRFAEAVLAEARRQARELQTADPARLASLRAKLAEADRKMARAAEALLDEENAGLLPALRERLRQRQKDRDAIATEVEDAGRAVTSAPDADALAAEAMDLAKVLAEASGAEQRAVLGAAVSYVELFFHREPYGKSRTRSRFAHGLVWLQPGLLADVLCQFTGVNGSPAPCRKTTRG
jgi:DNA invertase Pin-like site-specific DNA recombinase